MEMKPTPGPWYASQNDFYWSIESDHPHFKYQTVADLVNSTCVVDKDGTEHDHGEANARLIAAAPDLLAALKEAQSRLREKGMLGVDDAVSAVIAKAEGRSI